MTRAGIILRPVALHCRDCGLPIPGAEVAPSAGFAVCRLCDRTYPFAACREALPWGRSDDGRDVESVRLQERPARDRRRYGSVHEISARGDKLLPLGSEIDHERLRWVTRFLAARIRLGR